MAGKIVFENSSPEAASELTLNKVVGCIPGKLCPKEYIFKLSVVNFLETDRLKHNVRVLSLSLKECFPEGNTSLKE